jgi:hypothetical protein
MRDPSGQTRNVRLLGSGLLRIRRWAVDTARAPAAARASSACDLATCIHPAACRVFSMGSRRARSCLGCAQLGKRGLDVIGSATERRIVVNVSRPDLIGEMGDYLRETLRRCGLDCHCTSSTLTAAWLQRLG